MKSIERQLAEATQRLLSQRLDYKQAQIPIVPSPKAVVVEISGQVRDLVYASLRIKSQILTVCEVEDPLSPAINVIDKDFQLFAETLHFDFEEAEIRLIQLLAEIIADQKKIRLDACRLHDTYVNTWTTAPMDIPVEWMSCLIPNVRSQKIAETQLLNPLTTGFRLCDGTEGLTIFNNRSTLVDPRLTRTHLMTLLRHIAVSTVGKTGRPVDIQFSSQDQA